ncbi:hypothetical protein BGZ46_002299 [Entomortierella lignicola]|nr:hypothetical protein BGZ46_002299 [Entomortierella lignicola]
MEGTNPTRIPEILVLISKHLKKRHIIQCLLVCKDWYRLLLPSVWESVLIDESSSKKNPQKNMLGHKDLVNRLTCPTNPSEQHRFTFEFPNLKILEVLSKLNETRRSYSNYSDSPTFERYYIEMIKLNPTIVDLRLRFQSPKSHTVELWKAVSGLPHLEILHVERLKLDDEIEKKLFLDVCSKIKEVYLQVGGDFYRMSKDLAKVSFQRMKLLKFQSINILGNEDHLNFIRQAHSLEELSWMGPGDAFASDIEKGRWPSLERLEIYHQGKDTVSKRIIDGIHKITSLNMSRSEFGPLAFQALQRHYSTLEKLDLEGCSDATGPLLLEVLALCPNLKFLSGCLVKARDVVESAPWACENLMHLKVCIEFEEIDQKLQPQVFKRLSALIHLRVLEVGDQAETERPSYQNRLNLQVKSGLYHLSALKGLRTIGVAFSNQEMEADDIRWLIKNLKKLQSINCRLNKGIEENKDLCRILRIHDIDVSYVPKSAH